MLINGIGIGVPYEASDGGSGGKTLNKSSLYLPLKTTIVPARGTSTPTFTRGTAAWDFDSEGKLNLNIPSSCVRFTGARFVRNLISSKSEDFTNASWGAYRIVPNAGKIIPDNTLGGHRFYQTVANVAGTFALSVDAKAAELSKLCLAIATSAEAVQHRAIYDLVNVTATTDAGSGPTPTIVSLGSGWYRCSITGTTTSAASGAGVFIYAANAAGETTFTGNNTDGILVTKVQWENVSGQADQTASEYVSVGVLSAPFHGAGVDGCKWFNTNKDGSAISAATLKGYLAEPSRVNNCYWGRDLRAQTTFGTIKPWISSTAGGELLTNGDFAADSTWVEGAGWTISAGVATKTAGSAGDLSQTITITAGKAYTLTYTMTRTAGNLFVRLGSSSGNLYLAPTTNGTYTVTILAAGGTGILYFGADSSWAGTLDNISIKEAAIQVTAATGLDNVANSASQLTAAASDATLLQLLTAATGTRTFSAWIKRVSGSGTISLTRNGGTDWTDITSSLVTGTWVPVALTSDVGANPTVGLKLATSGDVIEVDCCQDENGAWRTSPILTTTAAVTRNADVLSYADALTSNNFTALASVQFNDVSSISDRRAFQVYADLSNYWFLSMVNATDTRYTSVIAGAFTTLIKTSTSISKNTIQKLIASASSTAGKKVTRNGLAVTSDANINNVNISDLNIGGSGGLSGNIGEVHIWATALTDAQMQQVTT